MGGSRARKAVAGFCGLHSNDSHPDRDILIDDIDIHARRLLNGHIEAGLRKCSSVDCNEETENAMTRYRWSIAVREPDPHPLH